VVKINEASKINKWLTIFQVDGDFQALEEALQIID